MKTAGQTHFNDLYQRHLNALLLQGKAKNTIDSYSRAIRRLATFLQRSPDTVTAEELKAYFAQLVKSHSWSTVKIDRNGIQFFFHHVLGKSWHWVDIVKPPVVKRLPDILTHQDIASIVTHSRERRYQTFWLTTYSMGLRISEAFNLKVSDIDSQRMHVHIRHAKGNKDRWALLPELTLRALRHYWKTHRHPPFLFPGKPTNTNALASTVMDKGTTQRAFSRIVKARGITSLCRFITYAIAMPRI